ncbi:MAG: COX15/CtaA family protein [Schleiferiaceae bacterium]|jgi:heme a synthase|nr:COX15/CtaA family protein [Schleiferiaceae bacterium]MDP4759295.1 COX15/CtaA family protein [Schleiferiaceae bacterium]MDP4768318.1 COX15/CtaA family protein [Schleiferiaceae bacterium]MDP4878046.1 COX15/CtaA family protein [Schleiferiaceae bacterium]MDP4959654.1 COX15/CtaA family protein [Schleiferiaceae bacterium]
MQHNPLVRRLATISLVFIFLVILAGSVVRATGSGMGCPDWPQCFGYTIPPTDVETLTWRAARSFEEGQMILLKDQFWVATADFTTGEEFASENWTLFDRHDYNIFNPVHTWIEFINRLIGALSGLPVLALAIIGMWGVRRNVWNAVLSVGVLFLLLFEAWLGKLVVDGNLVPNQITIHMMGSVAIVLLLLALRARNTPSPAPLPKPVRNGLLFLLVLIVVQIFLGTQTRELVDAAFDHNESVLRTSVIPSIEAVMPKIHRSFAWVILIVTSLLYYLRKKHRAVVPGFGALIFAIALEWSVGVVLYFLGLPKAMQPVHLVLSIGILASISYPLFLSFRKS